MAAERGHRPERDNDRLPEPQRGFGTRTSQFRLRQDDKPDPVGVRPHDKRRQSAIHGREDRPEGAGTEKKVGIRLVALDERADLALVRLGTGRLSHIARVAPRGFNEPVTWAYSCGYDGMRLPAVWARTRIHGSQGLTTFTQQPPGHGRSGGALFDTRTGQLVGVVQGYTLERPPVGLYASLASIHAFLDRSGFGRVVGDVEPRGGPPMTAGPGASGRRDDPAPARPCPP